MVVAAHHSQPGGFETVEALEERLSRPDADVVADLQQLDGDILILGATGKMGPTLARMAKRAAPERQVWAAARFSDAGLEEQFARQDIRSIKADLLEQADLDRLPDAPNVIIMTGYKFGASGNPSHTWAVNSLLPARLAKHFAGRRLVVFSTGCVYPFVPTTLAARLKLPRLPRWASMPTAVSAGSGWSAGKQQRPARRHCSSG